MNLKQKATGKQPKGLSKKAISENNNVQIAPTSIAPEPGTAPMFDAPPPLLPPTYQYIEIFARIPGLRKKAGV